MQAISDLPRKTKIAKHPEPVEDVDYFIIKRVRYELHVEGVFFIIADEECDDFEVNAARIDLSEPMIVSTTVVGIEERRIDDPTKPFDRKGWHQLRSGERVRPKSETQLDQFGDPTQEAPDSTPEPGLITSECQWCGEKIQHTDAVLLLELVKDHEKRCEKKPEAVA